MDAPFFYLISIFGILVTIASPPSRKIQSIQLFLSIMLQPASASFSAIVPAPFGFMGVRTEPFDDRRVQGDCVSELVYLPAQFCEKPADNFIAERAALQIRRYFDDPDFVFDLPLKTVGTQFQQRVWNAIAAIPRGQVRTYGAVAKLLKSAPRAVGQACGANRFPLIIPCHRVTAAGGLGGFAHHDDETGFHLGVKRYLLELEQVPDYIAPPDLIAAKREALV